MLGRSHAASGAAAWLGGMVALHGLGHPQPPSVIAIGTALAAGGALLPDLDMSGRVLSCEGGATVARTFGVASLFVAECVEKASLGVYNITKSRYDEDLRNGHRTLTHTLPFVLGAGFGVYELCRYFGRWAVAAVLFVAFATAVRGLADKWVSKAGWLVTTLASAVAAFGAFWWLPSGQASPLLAVALGFGAVVHLAGDSLTTQGCPLLAPFIPIRGRRWYRVGPPKALRMRTGGRVEAAFGWLFAVVGFGMAGWLGYLAAPGLTHDVPAHPLPVVQRHP